MTHLDADELSLQNEVKEVRLVIKHLPGLLGKADLLIILLPTSRLNVDTEKR